MDLYTGALDVLQEHSYVLQRSALENRRAYLRDMGNMPIEQQRWMARDAGITVVYEHGTRGRKINVRSAYVSALRAGDEAWLPRLDVLVLPKAERGKVRATADLAAIIAEILGCGAIIVEGATGITSRDGQRWKERVEWAMRRAGSGRMTSVKARRIGAKGGAVIKARAVQTRWLAPGMKRERDRWASVWRDPIHSNDERAAAAIDVPELRGRKHLCRRIFGSRRPGDKRAGGRPRKR